MSQAGPLQALEGPNEDADIRAQIERYPRLSPAEEGRLLAARGRAGEAATRRLIEHNLDLVYHAAQARRDRGISFGDLFQEGSVALISAVEHYAAAPAGFRPALAAAIAASLDDALTRTQDARRNDDAFVRACQVLETAQRLLAGQLKREATEAELAQLLHWDAARVHAIRGMLDEARGQHDEELLPYLDELDGENH